MRFFKVLLILLLLLDSRARADRFQAVVLRTQSDCHVDFVKADDQYVRQLEQLDVDFIAYQDEIGVEKTKVEESAAFFENLYKMHKKASKSRLWADVEVFRFEGKVYQSALLPAPAERVIRRR